MVKFKSVTKCSYGMLILKTSKYIVHISLNPDQYGLHELIVYRKSENKVPNKNDIILKDQIKHENMGFGNFTTPLFNYTNKQVEYFFLEQKEYRKKTYGNFRKYC